MTKRWPKGHLIGRWHYLLRTKCGCEQILVLRAGQAAFNGKIQMPTRDGGSRLFWFDGWTRDEVGHRVFSEVDAWP